MKGVLGNIACRRCDSGVDQQWQACASNNIPRGGGEKVVRKGRVVDAHSPHKLFKIEPFCAKSSTDAF